MAACSIRSINRNNTADAGTGIGNEAARQRVTPERAHGRAFGRQGPAAGNTSINLNE
jgi:hypothetical protein